MIVTYFMESPAVLHATRHELGCGTLKRAMLAAGQGLTSGGRGPARWNRLQVWDDEVYKGMPENPWQLRLKDHNCVKGGRDVQQASLVAGDTEPPA